MNSPSLHHTAQLTPEEHTALRQGFNTMNTAHQPITLEQVKDLSPAQLSTLPAHDLARLIKEVTHAEKWAKKRKNALEAALQHRYLEYSKSQLQAQRKEFGTTKFMDGNIEVKATLGRAPLKWDQQMMTSIVNRLQKKGQNLAKAVKVTYDMSATQFDKLASHDKAIFEPACTVKPKKPSFTLTIKEHG
ncbi:DUF7173 family protein [Magnetococcales bacterium HHB-1]